MSVVPVTRLQWVQRSLDAYRPLFESLADSLAAPPPEPQVEGGDPLSAMLGQLMGAMAPMMLGVTAGGMIGHLAQRSFGQYDLPIPRQPSDELLLVLTNVVAFGDDWSIDRRDLLLWLCLHEICHHAVLGVPHVRSTLETLLRDYAAGFRPDANAMVDKLGAVDMTDPSALEGLQDVLGDPEVVLGAIQTDAQRAMLPRLESLVAVIVGYVDHVMDAIGGGLIGSYGMITEAIRRRRVEADESDRFVARLFGLQLEQPTYDTGAAFVDGVVERAGFDALDAAVARRPLPAHAGRDRRPRPLARPHRAPRRRRRAGRRLIPPRFWGAGPVRDTAICTPEPSRRASGTRGLFQMRRSAPRNRLGGRQAGSLTSTMRVRTRPASRASPASSTGWWLCPKMTTSASGNHRWTRRARPLVAPVSCTMANRTPSTTSSTRSGRIPSSSWSLLPRTASTGANPRSSSRSSGMSTSPACQMRSASSSRS